jgi:hypothetical protein
MTTFESALYYANPGQERLRLWQKENKHEIELEFKDMQRDIDAELGQSIRKIIQAPHEHQAIVRLCQAADKKVAELAMVLNEGVEAEADRLRTTFMHAALTHPGESVGLSKYHGLCVSLTPTFSFFLRRSGSNRRSPGTHQE